MSTMGIAILSHFIENMYRLYAQIQIKPMQIRLGSKTWTESQQTKTMYEQHEFHFRSASLSNVTHFILVSFTLYLFIDKYIINQSTDKAFGYVKCCIVRSTSTLTNREVRDESQEYGITKEQNKNKYERVNMFSHRRIDKRLRQLITFGR